MNKGYYFFKCIGFAILVALAALAFGWILMLLWNWLVPALFHGPVINFWQAIGILILSKMLFGGCGFRGKGGRCCGSGYSKHGYWRNKFSEKMANMTPEEREKFKQEYANKCGSWGYKMESKEETKE